MITVGTTTGRMWFTGFNYHAMIWVWVQGQGWTFGEEMYGDTDAAAAWLTERLLPLLGASKGTA